MLPLCDLLHSPVTPCSAGTNIFLCALSHTLNTHVCSSADKKMLFLFLGTCLHDHTHFPQLMNIIINSIHKYMDLVTFKKFMITIITPTTTTCNTAPKNLNFII